MCAIHLVCFGIPTYTITQFTRCCAELWSCQVTDILMIYGSKPYLQNYSHSMEERPLRSNQYCSTQNFKRVKGILVNLTKFVNCVEVKPSAS